LAEGLSTLLLVATIVGSGIMADALSNDVAISLLGNTIATGAILFVLITILVPYQVRILTLQFHLYFICAVIWRGQ